MFESKVCGWVERVDFSHESRLCAYLCEKKSICHPFSKMCRRYSGFIIYIVWGSVYPTRIYVVACCGIGKKLLKRKR